MSVIPATSALPGALGLSNEAYEAMLETVRHYSNMARNAITTQNPPITPPKVTPAQQRRMACTHLTMKRLYGDYKCMLCRRVPEIGWVYVCTQDEEEAIMNEQGRDDWNGDVANSDGYRLGQANADGPTEQEPPRSATPLSPWIEKAIAEGHYTPEEETILRLQKQNVNNKIAESIRNFNDAEAASSTNRSPSLDTNSYLPFPVINQVADSPNDEILPTNLKPAARIFPYCEYRACQACRPTFRDRAWQRFEDIFEDRTEPSIDFETDNRPLSSPAIVASLGLYEPKRARRHRPLLHTFDSMGIHRARSGKRNLEAATMDDQASVDVIDQSDKADGKGIKHSIKRAFRDMLTSRRDSIGSNRSSFSSTRPRNTIRKARVREGALSDDSPEYDLGLWQNVNENILEEASHTRLPGRDGHDGLDKQAGEVEVEDGVAVTEEGVDTGTADIIMSV